MLMSAAAAIIDIIDISIFDSSPPISPAPRRPCRSWRMLRRARMRAARGICVMRDAARAKSAAGSAKEAVKRAATPVRARRWCRGVT